MLEDIYLDFEFNHTSDSPVNLVSCATLNARSGERKRWWLHKDKSAQKKLREYIEKFEVVNGYACVAEARSFLALGMNPLDHVWYDEFFEYRMATNHNDLLQWGKQLVDGKVKFVTKPKNKWERSEDDIKTGFKATHSLAECTYKLTGHIRDTEHKNKMRDLIISAPDLFTDTEATDIMDYGDEDIIYLPQIKQELIEHILKLDPATTKEQYLKEAYWRGRYAAHTAIMEDRGYPIDYDKTKNFSSQVSNILYDCQKDINSLFPNIKPFRWNKKENRMSENQGNMKDWIRECSGHVDNWMLTDTKDLSLSQDAWAKFYDFKHDYPRDNFGAQMMRYLKMKQSLYGFTTSGKAKRNFWDNVGSDHMVRPWMNPFGAQSSRSQPAATGFMFLKPAWMRALVVPPKGKVIGGVDFSQQEFFLSALTSQDGNMVQSYLSGDVYLAFAKLAGMVPIEGTRDKYESERDVCKSTVLGISYLMSKYGLAIKLTQDSGRVWDHDEAQSMIDNFYEAYPELRDSQEYIVERYSEDRFLKLPDGWYMWGDNENHRSVTNMYIQGFGAAIMRKSVDLAVAAGLEVIKTLHDALYIMFDIGDEYKLKVLADCMREAFIFYFEGEMAFNGDMISLKELAGNIRLDPKAWSPDFDLEGDERITAKEKVDAAGKVIETNYILAVDDFKIPVSHLHVDKRAIKDYEAFSQYFEFQEWTTL